MERAAKYQIGGWMSDQEPFEVEVHIIGAHWVQSFKEAPPALPEFQSIPAKDGQSMTVKFKANHENGPSRWILQFGAAAEVVAPAGLRDLVASQHAQALEHYTLAKQSS
jgi:predicted DNA-binding transcriptional regulator YafY